MQRGDHALHRPIATVTDTSPIEFFVPGSPEDYIDLGRTRLVVTLKVTKADGTDMADDAKVSTVNLLLHSLFSQVDCKLNQKLVSPSQNTYPYKAYLETVLAHGKESKSSWLACEMFYPEEKDPTGFDPTAGTADEGLKARNKRILKSRTVELVGRPHVDIFQQDKYLLNGVDLSLRFIRASKEFTLMGDDIANYNISMTDASLYVRKVKLNPAIALEHQKSLQQGITAKYPLRRGVVSTFTIPRGVHSHNKENVTTGQLPRRIIIGFVTNEAFNGGIKLNPFYFQHFKVEYLAFNTDNQQFPTQPLKPNFTKLETVSEFYQMYSGLGLTNSDGGLNISLAQFMAGYTLYALDLTPDMAEGNHIEPVKYGNLRMEVKFGGGLQQPINCICYAEYDNMIQIDQARNIITDFGTS